MGVLLELKGMGCRHLEHVLQAMKTGWYHFLSRCMDYGGIFKRLDLASHPVPTYMDSIMLRSLSCCDGLLHSFKYIQIYPSLKTKKHLTFSD